VPSLPGASRNNGYGVQSPASLPNVLSVGGTTVRLNADLTRLSETAWSGAGSGCGAHNDAQAWQASALVWDATSCSSARGTSDVAADADPSTGASVYDAIKLNGRAGWYVLGGTSLAAPIISGIIALAQSARGCNGRCDTPYPPRIAYNHPEQPNDIVIGSNGPCTTAVCVAGEGFDGPTGLGAPRGIGAFVP
jgi:hypothetical protein